MHAIGDAAVASVLDAFEATGAAGSVEHAHLVVPDDLARMARLGLRASVQPAHLLADRDVAEGPRAAPSIRSVRPAAATDRDPRRPLSAHLRRWPEVAALRAFARGTRRYVVVSTVFGLVVAVGDVGALYGLGVPLPLLWGLVSFVTNDVPNVGFVLGLVPPALLGLLEGGVGEVVGVVVAYSVIDVVIQSFLQPKFVGDAVGPLVTLTFLSLGFWTFAIGPLGALLAIPLSLLVEALLVDADPASQWLRPLLETPRRGTAPPRRRGTAGAAPLTADGRQEAQGGGQGRRRRRA